MLNRTSGVLVLVLGLDVAVGGSDLTSEDASIGANLAIGASVERHAVICLVVDSLQDINFSTMWPVRAYHPETGKHVSRRHEYGAMLTYAGQVPQPVGMCSTSRTTSPVLYFFLLTNLRLGRPLGVSLVESTPHSADPAVDALMRFVCRAVASSTYLTNPSNG